MPCHPGIQPRCNGFQREDLAAEPCVLNFLREMRRPAFREIRLVPEPFKDLSFGNASHTGVCSGHCIAVIAIRKERCLGKHLSGPGTLQDDRATMFLVPDEVNLALQHDKERQDRVTKVEQIFVRTKSSFRAAGRCKQIDNIC